MKHLELLDTRIPLKYSPAFKFKSFCPRLLYLYYGKHEERQVIKPHFERGKSGHAAAEELLTYVLDERIAVGDLDDEQLREAVERHTPYEIVREIGEILRWMHLFRERFTIRRPETVVGLEERLSIDDEYDSCEWDEASYRGILDMLQIDGDTAIIWDWKSQFNIWSDTDLKDHDPSTFYAWLVWREYPHISRFIVNIWYFRYGFYSSTVRLVPELSVFEDNLVMHEHKLLELDNIDPVPGPQCGVCDYSLDCPLGTDLRPENPNIISQEQAVLAAQRLTVM